MAQPKVRKSPDKRPARARYWNSGRLAFNKIRNLVLSGYTLDKAVDLWDAARKGRLKSKLIPIAALRRWYEGRS